MTIAIEPLLPLAMPLDGVRLIEASAGTGKTWTIAALYVRAVLGHGLAQALLPPQILVVTFTEAATQELRERIRARLVEASQSFRRGTARDAFLTELLAAYPSQAHAGCARRLELAAQWMDEASIFTIHGWSQRMLVQHAFGSGHAFAQTLEPDESELLAECVRDYWRQAFYPRSEREIEAVLAEWKTPDALLAALRPLLSSDETTLRVNGEVLDNANVGDLFAALQAWQDENLRRFEAARDAWLGDVERVETLLRDAVTGKTLKNNVHQPASLERNLAGIRQWAATGDAGSVDIARYGSSRLEAATAKGKSRPEHPAFGAVEHWSEWQAGKPSIRFAILAEARTWVRERFAEQKRRRAQIGFDDLLLRLDRALASTAGDDLAATIRQQFPLALIDEFQDTDPLQYRIFRAVYGGATDVGLLLIGDPKQAIYAFRGADIHTYLSARGEAMSPHYSLDTNHRSSAALVDAVNAVFAHAERHATGAFHFAEHGLPFVPVQAKGREEVFTIDGQPRPALHVWLLDDEAPVGVRLYREQMAGACATQIVQLLEAAAEGACGFSHPDGSFVSLKPADIAILVRSRTEAADVRAALSERNVRSVFLSDRHSVLDSGEARDMLLWLRAVAEPSSDGAMRAALATRTLGLGYGELERLNTEERHWERRGQQLFDLREVWRSGGVLAMVHRLLHAFDLPARLLVANGGERTLTNVLHLAEWLQQAAATIEGEQALIRHFAERIADVAVHTGDEQIVRLESDDDLVRVVTIHKSKGLEYPLVFLPFACAAGGGGGRGQGYRYHDGQTAQVELLSASHGSAGAAVDEAKEAAERAALQEDLRLFYVALTRARHACWIGVAPVCYNHARKPQVHRGAFGHLLSGGAEIDNGAIEGLLRDLAQGHPSIAIDYMPAPDERRFAPPRARALPHAARQATARRADPWWIASYSALRYSDDAVVAPETAADDVIVEYATEPVAISADTATIHAFRRGAEAGTFLHDLLEWIAEEGFATIAADPVRLRDTVARRCERRGWEASIDLLTDWLSVLLTTAIDLPDGGTLTLASFDDPATYRAELEFLFEARGVDTLALDRIVREYTLDGAARPALTADVVNGMLKGFIDLIVEHDGRWYVADYKSNWLGADEQAYTPAAMRRSILDSRYELQYALYLLALHRQLRARLGDAYDYDTHVGGAVYLYLRGVDGRGHGVHVERPPKAMVDALDRLFRGVPA